MLSLRRWVMRVLPYLQRSFFQMNFRALQLLHSQYSAHDWDRQYESGVWDYLLSSAQIPRVSATAAYCELYAGKGGAILEIGYGNGALASRLKSAAYSRYTGVDISEAAVTAASRDYGGGREHFVCADATTYVPDRKYDVIAFNECLNYFDDPALIIKRYDQYLTDGGAFIVSMYENLKAKSIWRVIGPFCVVKDELVIVRPADRAWHRIKAFTLANREASADATARQPGVGP